MKIEYRNITKDRVLSRRLSRLLSIGLFIFFTHGVAVAGKPTAMEGEADVTVYKTEFCGCCTKWTDHLEQSGLSVNVIVVKDTSPIRSKLGVPRNLASCHTAEAGGYWIEGHVPGDLVSQLLKQKPDDIQGLAVPGMPAGSPGMDVPNSPAYRVISVDNDGKPGVYAVRN